MLSDDEQESNRRVGNGDGEQVSRFIYFFVPASCFGLSRISPDFQLSATDTCWIVFPLSYFGAPAAHSLGRNGTAQPIKTPAENCNTGCRFQNCHQSDCVFLRSESVDKKSLEVRLK